MAKASRTRTVRPPSKSTEPAERPMDIHKPKPIHSLRELASEIGVIVLGILIALGLEQAIETWHTREDAARAREAILGELHENLIMARTVVSTDECSERQLAALSDAIGRGDGARTRTLLANAAFPRPDGWPDSNWQAALASGTVSHFEDDERVSFSSLYVTVSTIKAKQERYVNAYARLQAMAVTGLAASPEASRAEVVELAEMTAALRDMQAIARDFPLIARAVPAGARYARQLEVSPSERNFEPYERRVAQCQAVAGTLPPVPRDAMLAG